MEMVVAVRLAENVEKESHYHPTSPTHRTKAKRGLLRNWAFGHSRVVGIMVDVFKEDKSN